MIGSEQETIRAVSMAKEAADLLDSIGDRAGAMRFRHAAAVVGHDALLHAPAGAEIPMSLMKMALAILDRDGHGTTDTAISLQLAIDRLREAPVLAEGEEIDLDLLAPIRPGRLN